MAFVCTPHRADASDVTRQKMDAAMYPKKFAPTDTARADWSRVELSFEVKPSSSLDDPVDDRRKTIAKNL